MDIDHLTEKERYDMLAEMADMYYNQGKTQSEIAKYFETNRFRVAKLIQDARNEQIVEIKINHSNERNSSLEAELMKKLPLQKAIVVNTQYSSYIDSMKQVGKAGADYLQRLLKPGTTIGLTWGKTIYSVVSQLPSVVNNPVTSVQMTGGLRTNNPATDSRELVRTVATSYNGTYHFLYAPIYVNSNETREALRREPMLRETFEKMGKMDVVLSGLGGKSSLPLSNPVFREYLTEKDRAFESSSIGSLYGYVLDQEGNSADIDLNRKLVGASLEDILKTPHRLVVACGRHKANCICKTIEKGLFNELITDSDTAFHLIESLEK